jgi:hypothetical protein
MKVIASGCTASLVVLPPSASHVASPPEMATETKQIVDISEAFPPNDRTGLFRISKR